MLMRTHTLGLGETCLLKITARLLLWQHRWLAWRHAAWGRTMQSCMIWALGHRHASISAKQVA